MRYLMLAGLAIVALAGVAQGSGKGACYNACYQQAKPCYGMECRGKVPGCYEACDNAGKAKPAPRPPAPPAVAATPPGYAGTPGRYPGQQ